jgi:hypothetical protein
MARLTLIFFQLFSAFLSQCTVQQAEVAYYPWEDLFLLSFHQTWPQSLHALSMSLQFPCLDTGELIRFFVHLTTNLHETESNLADSLSVLDARFKSNCKWPMKIESQWCSVSGRPDANMQAADTPVVFIVISSCSFSLSERQAAMRSVFAPGYAPPCELPEIWDRYRKSESRPLAPQGRRDCSS